MRETDVSQESKLPMVRDDTYGGVCRSFFLEFGRRRLRNPGVVLVLAQH